MNTVNAAIEYITPRITADPAPTLERHFAEAAYFITGYLGANQTITGGELLRLLRTVTHMVVDRNNRKENDENRAQSG